MMKKIEKTFEMQDTTEKKNPIRYINAHNGGIQMYGNGCGELVAWGKTPEMIAYALKTKGIADNVRRGGTEQLIVLKSFQRTEPQRNTNVVSAALFCCWTIQDLIISV